MRIQLDEEPLNRTYLGSELVRLLGVIFGGKDEVENDGNRDNLNRKVSRLALVEVHDILEPPLQRQQVSVGLEKGD